MSFKKGGGSLGKWFRGMMYLFPVALCCSYFPVIRLGGNESMNFELSLTLIWLVVFDFIVFELVWRRKLWGEILRNWRWLLLPLFLSCSVLWSLNFLRGVLTVGVLWLVYFAGYGMVSLRDLWNKESKARFWEWFFGTFLVVCGICWLQCLLDIFGVSRGVTQLCEGCSYTMFGFPHPNGFSIEPQFMGNLLIAPAIITGYMIIRDGVSRKTVWLFLIYATTLFLTFSRGAIYAFILAMVGMVVFMGVKKKVWRQGLMVVGGMAVAFILCLNLQGVMTAMSRTRDTYWDGVSKVVNQLSLGVVDLRGGENGESDDDSEEDFGEGEEAVFDGYVAESTDTRMRLTKAAVKIFMEEDWGRRLFGVGLGGAGRALYNYELSPAPKEIVQNQYASLLLETGMVGVALFIYTMYLVFRVSVKNGEKVLFITLIFAYGITLFFFSGLPNALQIYTVPVVVYTLGPTFQERKASSSRESFD